MRDSRLFSSGFATHFGGSKAQSSTYSVVMTSSVVAMTSTGRRILRHSTVSLLLEKSAGSSHRAKKGRPIRGRPITLVLSGRTACPRCAPGIFLLLLTGPSARPGQRLSASYGQQSDGQDWQVSAVPVTPRSHTPSPQLGLHESPTGGWSWKFPSLMKCETRYATGEVGSAVQWISISYASGHSEQVCARQSGCRAVFTGSATESTRHTLPNVQLLISTDPLGSGLVHDSSILHAPTGFWKMPAGSPKSLTWAL